MHIEPLFMAFKMRHIIYIIAILMLSCCNQQQNFTIEDNDYTTDSTIVINLVDELDKSIYPLDKLVEYFKIVPLETQDGTLLSAVHKFITTQEYIYILDSYSNGNVAIFDIRGNFVRRIPYGGGPGELGFAEDICFDNNLYIKDGATGKVMQMTPDGSFISEVWPNVLFDKMAIVNNKLFVDQLNFQNYDNQFSLIKTDSCFNIEKVWRFSKTGFNPGQCNSLRKYGTGISFGLNTDNGIFHIKDSILYKKYLVVDNVKTNLDSIKVHEPSKNYSILGDGEYVFRGTFKESNHWLNLFLVGKTNTKQIYYNKKKNLIYTLFKKPNAFYNFIEFVEVFNQTEDIFSGIVLTEFFKSNSIPPEYRWDGSNPNNLISPEDMEKLRNVTPDDNPIIVLFKLKDDI